MSEEANPLIASVALSSRLREAGLAWKPQDGDRFFIPDRDLGDRVWSISEMVIEERLDILGRRELAFNGAVEWALDSIIAKEVVWIPTEGQLRQLLGSSFIALTQEENGQYACVVRVDDIPTTFHAETAADAYATALLARLA